jgi:DNA-binding MarR family transcriptional regulator
MRLGWQWVRDQIYAGVVAAGYDDLNPSHVALFRYPGLDGVRPTELADQVQITKQSVNDLLGHLEQHGYIVREPDPADGRARVVRLTKKGWRFEDTVNAQAQAAEERMTAMLGARRFAQLRDALVELAQSITGNDPPASTSAPR